MRKKNQEKIRKNNNGKNKVEFRITEKIKGLISGILMCLVAVIIILAFFDRAGVAGEILIKTLSFLFGKVRFGIPIILLVAGIVFLKTEYQKILLPMVLAISILIMGTSGIFGALDSNSRQGGFLGYILSWPTLKFFGFWPTQIIFLTLILIANLIFWQFLISPFQKSKEKKPEEEKIIKEKPLLNRIFRDVILSPKFKVKEVSPPPKEEKISPLPLELKTKPLETPPLTKTFQSPPFDLLEEDREVPTSGDIRTNSAIIKKTLQNFDIPVEMSEINIGPTVTQYTLKPAEGIKLSKITTLVNNLSLALASHPIRIEAPIPGRSLVGIEIPNKTRAQVRLRNLIQASDFQNSSSNLIFVLGRDVSGSPVFADLARMPHLLVAGSTGTGKTIFLNTLILSLLYKNSPETLRFILIDPKRVEFPIYNNLPHLLSPVIYDAQKTINALKWLVGEMERRFEVFAGVGARDIVSYNRIVAEKSEPIMPYIVLIIDELADLMVAKGREIEVGIVRLAQLSRAVGVHLVVATQRPSVEVITGLIKANITSRVTFQVASQVDSRTVLDMAGAEKLLGLGDLLFVSAEIVKPKRIQGAYVSEKEVKKVVNWVKSKIGASESKIEIEDQLREELEKTAETLESKLEISSEEDPLYEEAKKVVFQAKKASASLLQRRLRIGYARAARIIDLLEEKGIVGPADGAKPREVYLLREEDKTEENEDWQKI